MENITYGYSSAQQDGEFTYGEESFNTAIEESEAAFAEIYCSSTDDDDEKEEEDISDWGNNDPRTGGGDEPTAPGSAV